MKTKYDTLKTSMTGAIAAALMAISAHSSAADVSLPIWAGQFKAAYDSTSEQTGSTSVRSGSSSVKDTIVWAGHFERAYGPSSQRADVATGPGRVSITERLLWAGHFKDAYQPAREATVEGIELAMDRN